MAEVSYYVSGPYEGLSQVPPQVRLQGACKSMINCLAIVPYGLQPRPPLEFLANLGYGPDVSGTLFQSVPRGSAAEDLTLVVSEVDAVTDVRLFRTSTWASIPITSSPAAETYLNQGPPDIHLDLRAVTIEDTTFLANRQVTVADAGDSQAARPFEALVWVKTGGYSRRYVVSVNKTVGGTPVTSTYQPNNGGLGPHALGVTTEAILDGLINHTVIGGSDAVVSGDPLTDLTTQGFVLDRIGSVLRIKHTTADFTVAIEDGAGGSTVTVIKDEVQRFSDLPAVAFDGFTVRIAQAITGGLSDYYVTFVPAGATNTGIWQEVVAPGSLLGLDPVTMPVGLTVDTLGDWSMDTLPWLRRQTGNPTLSPDPSFVGDQVNAISWFKGRLALVSGGSVSLSDSANPFNFYATTLTASLDSDPVGLLPPGKQKVYFKDAVAFEEKMAVIGDGCQAAVSTIDGTVRPTSTGIDPVASTGLNFAVPVQECDGRLYYVAPRPGSSIIYELAVEKISGKVRPEDMTLAVPNLLPKALTFAASHNADFVTVYAVHGDTTLYVHTYRYQKEDRVQNAWSLWTMPDGFTFEGGYFQGSMFCVLLKAPSGDFVVCQMDMTPNSVDPGGQTRTHLDLRHSSADCTVVYDAPTDTTRYLLPNGMPVLDATIATVAAPGTPDFPEAYRPTVSARAGAILTLDGDWTGVPLWIGRTYVSEFTPSRWYAYGQDQRPLSGRLTMRRLEVDLSKYGYLRAEVTTTGRATRTYVHEGYDLDDANTPLDAVPDEEAPKFMVSLGATNDQTSVRFVCDSPTGFRLMGYRWRADMSDRGSRSMS